MVRGRCEISDNICSTTFGNYASLAVLTSMEIKLGKGRGRGIGENRLNGQLMKSRGCCLDFSGAHRDMYRAVNAH